MEELRVREAKLEARLEALAMRSDDLKQQEADLAADRRALQARPKPAKTAEAGSPPVHPRVTA